MSLLSAFQLALSQRNGQHATESLWNPSKIYLTMAWRVLIAREMERGSLEKELNGRYQVFPMLIRDHKDRYLDIRSYKPTNVTLPPPTSYVNASYIFEPRLFTNGPSPYRWIATQGPLSNTLFEFYFLFFSADGPPKTCVQLTGWKEGGRIKCERYVPEIGNELIAVEESQSSQESKRSVTAILLQEEQNPQADFVKRKLKLTLNERGQTKSLEIDHFQFLGWHDHSVPDSEQSVLNFIKTIIDCNNLNNFTNPPPIVIHCSAGVGRTGTLIAISTLLHHISFFRTPNQPQLQPVEPSHITSTAGLPSIWKEFQDGDLYRRRMESMGDTEQYKKRKDVMARIRHDPVVVTVDLLREQRNLMVQTIQQLKFVYNCLDVECNTN